MVIDAHNHPDWHGHDLSRSLSDMDANGIDRAWLLSWECPPSEYDPGSRSVLPGPLFPGEAETGPIPFFRVLSYLERAPGRFIGGYAPDPRRPGAVERLKAAVAIYGVRVCGELKLRMAYDAPEAVALFRYCGTAGLPVVVHLDYELKDAEGRVRMPYWYGGGIEAFARALALCPETVFLGHAPGFWSHISDDGKAERESYPTGAVAGTGRVVELLRTHPNLFCDLSAGSGLNALQRDPDHAVRFIAEFQDRILFGRDMFYGRHRAFLDALPIGNDARAKICAGNALRLVPV